MQFRTYLEHKAIYTLMVKKNHNKVFTHKPYVAKHAFLGRYIITTAEVNSLLSATLGKDTQ